MSADLFAAFNSPVEAPTQQQIQQGSAGGVQATATKNDPFSILAPGIPLNQVQQPTQWRPNPQQQQSQSGPPWSMSQSQKATSNWERNSGGPAGPSSILDAKDEDEDAWGDFEVASESTSTAPVPPALPITQGSTPTPSQVPAPMPFRTRTVRASTMDLMTNSLVEIGISGSKPAAIPDLAPRIRPEEPRPPKPKNTDPNVLFDADDFDGEPPQDYDDFGDFETVVTPVPANAPAEKPVVDLMSTDFAPQPTQSGKRAPAQFLSALSLKESPSPYPTAPKSPSFQERNPFPSLAVTTPKATEFPRDEKLQSPSPVTAWPAFEENDGKVPGQENISEDWGTFENLPPEPSKPKVVHKTAASVQVPKDPKPTSDWDWDSWDGDATELGKQSRGPESSTKTEIGPPPTNVPPPSILLSLFPQLLGSANKYLFKPTGGQPASIKDQVLSSPATIRFLRGYLALATVAGRVIAGRKLRWQRDKFLSQGMSISAAGGRGGMKLSGVDKSQAGHEDREATDVVTVWKELVGRLRSAVVAANSALGAGEQRLRIPELAGGMGVQTSKGALKASKACVICGLKRDERVKGVDFEVEDSFGEWWVEFWGHRACRNFWLEHEAQLRQR